MFYGWVIVAALSITETISWGILYYGSPVMLRPMEADLGFSRVQITGALSLGLAASALAALPVGGWSDRRGARGLMTLGSCLATALVLAWSRVESLGALYAVWFLMGLALATTLYEPAFAAVVGWFPVENRDRALLVVTLTAALASTIFMPLEAWLVDRLGWRKALVALAVILAVPTIPIHAFLLRRPPRLAARETSAERAGAAVPGLTPAHAGADGGHAGRRQRHGHARPRHDDRVVVRTAALRIDQRRGGARRQRRSRGRARRGRLAPGGPRRLRARVLAADRRAPRGGRRAPGGARTPPRTMR